MPRPVIGLPTYHHWTKGAPDERALEMRVSYCHAVAAAGGAPLLLPLIDDEDATDRLYGMLDGLLLCGGGDVDPSCYGAPDGGRNHNVNPARDRFELALARRALADGMPLFAICRGVQVLNVAAGGTLVQDIPTECPGALQHATSPRLPPEQIAHTVSVVPGSRLARALGRDGQAFAGAAVPVNSRHHQAIARVASGYVVSASASDGIIEAIEPSADASTPDSWVLGVQWHPENMAPVDPVMARLFRAFIATCRR